MPTSMGDPPHLPDLLQAASSPRSGASGDSACGGHRRRHQKAAPDSWRTCAAPRKSHHAQALLIAHAPELFGTASDARAACGAAYKTDTARALTVAHLVTQPAVATGGATKKRLQIHGEYALHLENRTTRKLCSLRTRLSCSAQRRMPELPVVLRTRRTLHPGPPSGVAIKGVPRAHSCAHHPQTSASQHLRPFPAAVSCSARHCCLQSVAARRSKWRCYELRIAASTHF